MENRPVTWMPEELHPVLLRLARADQASYELARVAFDWSRGEGDGGAIMVQQVERTPGYLDVEVTSIRPVPPVAAMLFSEAVHHLRSAIDNVVFYLAGQEHGRDFTPPQKRAVSMLIYDDQPSYERKVQRLAKQGLTMFGPDSQLGERMASIQPFNDDTASVETLHPLLADLMGVKSVGAHPLSLIREYSNEDKHHSIRLAAARVLVQRDDDWRRSVQQGMRPVEAGTVLETVRKGVPTATDLSAALHVQRPDGTWAPYGPELDGIARHVADVVIPVLVKGLALPGGLPVEIGLGDTGESVEDRMREAGTRRAHQRSHDFMWPALADAAAQEPRYPPIVGGAEPA